MGVKILICMTTMIFTTWAASVSNLDCIKVCEDPNHHDENPAVHCGCHNPHNHDASRDVTEAPVVAGFQHTTLSLCDYLCSIQMGGAACDCSVSIVPGKREAELS